jgi:hypothetical protein
MRAGTYIVVLKRDGTGWSLRHGLPRKLPRVRLPKFPWPEGMGEFLELVLPYLLLGLIAGMATTTRSGHPGNICSHVYSGVSHRCGLSKPPT